MSSTCHFGNSFYKLVFMGFILTKIFPILSTIPYDHFSFSLEMRAALTVLSILLTSRDNKLFNSVQNVSPVQSGCGAWRESLTLLTYYSFKCFTWGFPFQPRYLSGIKLKSKMNSVPFIGCYILELEPLISI